MIIVWLFIASDHIQSKIDRVKKDGERERKGEKVSEREREGEIE